MMHQTLAIELTDDVVFSARSATEGGHASLDRIPGAALLGAAAARLYGQISRRDAFAAFHSGRLRFGDGLPFDGSELAYPMPLAWHHAKALRPERDGRLDRAAVHNFQHCNRIDVPAGAPPDTELQPKQLRAGYVRSDGTWVRPAHSLRLKTAIDPDTGRAAEGQLFGYDALARGQRFGVRIEADDDLDAGLFRQVVDALAGSLLLGRSRSAEYGRAKAWCVDLDPPRHGPLVVNRLTLWLLSDLALADADGQPTLTLDDASLGLPGARLCHDQTFLRSRRYSPWNGARHGYDRERLVLSAGGVITLDLAETLTPEQAARLQAGIGLHREAGLGRLCINPPLLADKHPSFAPASDRPAGAPAQPRPDDPLIAWLEDQAGDWKAHADQAGLALAEEYLRLLDSARRIAGVTPGLAFGPSKSQWGRVLEVARERDARDLFNALFSGDAAVIKSRAEGWGEEVPVHSGDWRRLADWLEERLAYDEGQRGYAHKIRRLARRVRDDIDTRRV